MSENFEINRCNQKTMAIQSRGKLRLMNYYNMHSWDSSPHVILHLKQIYRLKKAWGKTDSQHEGEKNILEPYMTYGLYSGVYPHHFAENRLNV